MQTYIQRVDTFCSSERKQEEESVPGRKTWDRMTNNSPLGPFLSYESLTFCEPTMPAKYANKIFSCLKFTKYGLTGENAKLKHCIITLLGGYTLVSITGNFP